MGDKWTELNMESNVVHTRFIYTLEIIDQCDVEQVPLIINSEIFNRHFLAVDQCMVEVEYKNQLTLLKDLLLACLDLLLSKL